MIMRRNDRARCNGQAVTVAILLRLPNLRSPAFLWMNLLLQGLVSTFNLYSVPIVLVGSYFLALLSPVFGLKVNFWVSEFSFCSVPQLE